MTTDVMPILMPVISFIGGVILGFLLGIQRPGWHWFSTDKRGLCSARQEGKDIGHELNSVHIVATSPITRMREQQHPVEPPVSACTGATLPLPHPTDSFTAGLGGTGELSFPNDRGIIKDLPSLRTPRRSTRSTKISTAAVSDGDINTPLSPTLSGQKRRSVQRTSFAPSTGHLGNLVRAASAAMDEFESRSVLHRLTFAEATTFFPPSPTHLMMLSPGLRCTDAYAAEGGSTAAGMAVQLASDEVHMDEVDLLEKIGGGSFGSVYKGQWHGAPVAVKYVLTRTDDPQSLGRAIREVMLSKKMAHPNVVQTFSWTVLSQPCDSNGISDRKGREGNGFDVGLNSSAERQAPKRQALSSQANNDCINEQTSPAHNDVIPAVWPHTRRRGSTLESQNGDAQSGTLDDSSTVHSSSSDTSCSFSLDACAVKRRRTSTQSGGWTPSPSAQGVLAPRMDSFNSEEGFGSPIKRKHGGVQSVFALEAFELQPTEALLAVVMEHCDLGSLQRALRRRAFIPSAKWSFRATFRALLRTAAEIAKGMEYCHSFGVVHGDLKPGNVLLKTHRADRRGYVAKVADFGLSWHIDDDSGRGGGGGTLAFTAPEAFEENKTGGTAGDVYAFGIMMWCMFYCSDPYEGLLEAQVFLGVCEGWLRPRFEEGCPLRYRALAEQCWAQSPTARPSFSEICKELVKIEMDFRSQGHRRSNSVAAEVVGPPRPASAADAERKASEWVV